MNFNFPIYSTFFQSVLVEELALCSNPALVHYGKCSLLGYLSQPDTLGSLTIPNIERQYQVPDCAFNVRLKTSLYPYEFLHTTVEVFGEARLYDFTIGLDSPLQSSHSLIAKLQDFEEDLKLDKCSKLNARFLLQKKIEDFKYRYKAVVEVTSIRHVRDARDVIAKNLQFRIIQAKRKTLQRPNKK